MLQTKAVPKHQEEETVVLLSDSDEEEQQDEVEPEEVSEFPAVAPRPHITSGGLRPRSDVCCDCNNQHSEGCICINNLMMQALGLS